MKELQIPSLLGAAVLALDFDVKLHQPAHTCFGNTLPVMDDVPVGWLLP